MLLRRCRVWGIESVRYLESSMHLGNEIALSPEHESAVMQIAALLSRQQEDDTALEHAVAAMQILLSCLPDGTPCLFKAALLCDLAHAMEQLPANHPERNLVQIEVYYREALPCYQTANQLLNETITQRSLGIVLYEQGRYQEALVPLLAAFQLLQVSRQYDTLAGWTLSNYASALDGLGKTEDALVAYTEAIKLTPDIALLYRNRAEVLIHLRRLAQAEADLAQAVALDGHEQSSYLWYHRAQAAIARGEGLLADQMLDEVAKQDASLDVAFLRTQAAWLQGDLQTAQETFQQVWRKVNLGERGAIRREMERLFGEHPRLDGRGALEDIMMKLEQ